MADTDRTRPALEIAVVSAAGARLAADAGADRVELCSALELGGVTPSVGLIRAAVATGIPVHVLVRCRPGDAVYDADEVRTMTADVRAAVAEGAAGVVVGALRPDGTLDREALETWTDAASASGAEVTFHRAIDQSCAPVELVRDLAGTVDRVLTSGAHARAVEGRDVIAAMCAVEDGPQIMAGGGVRPVDIGMLAAAGVSGVHLSAKAAFGSAGLALGGRDDGTHLVTDPEVVRAARRALDALR
ncbi:copper homeostasis protein CutC [Microbacterium sp. CJ88]|uniref:copper homeostasis protein CutC n=1 Tax=Microbacterium sp. CJ88 TaxID=3445672 RepID=UPI003F65ABAF